MDGRAWVLGLRGVDPNEPHGVEVTAGPECPDLDRVAVHDPGDASVDDLGALDRLSPEDDGPPWPSMASTKEMISCAAPKALARRMRASSATLKSQCTLRAAHTSGATADQTASMPEQMHKHSKYACVGDDVVHEVQNRIAHAQCDVANARTRAAVVCEDVGDNDAVFNDVPGFNPDATDEKGREHQLRNPRGRDVPQRNNEGVKAREVERVEAQMQPFLGAVKLQDVSEQPQGFVVWHSENEDLTELDDVLDNVSALNRDHRGQEPEPELAQHGLSR